MPTFEEILEALKGDADLKGKVMAELNYVEHGRFKAKNTEARDLKAEIARLEGELSTAVENAKGTDGLRAQVEQLTERVTAADSRYQTFSTITAAGFTDPSVIRGIEAEWASLPEDSRGTLAETLAGWQSAPDTVPGLLRPHFVPSGGAGSSSDSQGDGTPAEPPPGGAPPENGQPQPPGAQPPARPPVPNPHHGARPAQPPGAAQYSAEQIAKATPEQYRAMRRNMGFPDLPGKK